MCEDFLNCGLHPDSGIRVHKTISDIMVTCFMLSALRLKWIVRDVLGRSLTGCNVDETLLTTQETLDVQTIHIEIGLHDRFSGLLWLFQISLKCFLFLTITYHLIGFFCLIILYFYACNYWLF